MRYKYNGNVQIPVKAQIVGEAIESLVKKFNGKLLPETVVSYAKKKSSPLHPCFEWNDKQAAEKYRRDQARYIIKSLMIVEPSKDDNDEPVIVRAFPSIETKKGCYYTTVARVYNDKKLLKHVESQVAEQLFYLRRKYDNLKRFRDVWKAIDKLHK